MLQYIKVQFRESGVAYQEVENGHVVRYVDENGDALFTSLDIHGNTVYNTPSDGCRVIDADPVIPPAMRANALEHRKPYSVEAHGDRRRGDRRSGR